MSIITKEVEVIPSGKNIKYYKDLGYDVEWHKPLVVKVSDLMIGSGAIIEVLCDACKENKMAVAYETYNRVVKNTGSYVCKECAVEKRTNTIYNKYGVYSAVHLDKFKEKMKETCLKRYNCVNPAQSLEIKIKIAQTFYNNGTTRTSKQQLYIFNLYEQTNNLIKLNYPIAKFNAVICFLKEKLEIEVDCGGHDLLVKTGKLTQEEHNQKEIIRNNIIKKEGYKQMRIISNNDKLPSDQVLLQMLSETKQYFSTYPNHSWIEYNISTSTLRNAENKQGVPYDFGALRTIKDSDLNVAV